MASRELLVVFLNQSNEELNLEAESPRVEDDRPQDDPEARPPLEIGARESGMWHCKAPHRRRDRGVCSRTRIVGHGANDKVTLAWDVHYVGAK